MKWLTLIIGGVIIIGGAWLLLSPQDTNGPDADSDESALEDSMEDSDEHEDGAMMEDGTLDSKDGDSVSSPQTAPPTTTPTEPVGETTSQQVVTYTAEGYSPATVTISKGETVRFINKASNGMWTAGNNHPTHTIYPEKSSNDCLGASFDTCRSISSGETWEFTFGSVGSWGYHNHVRSSDGGTIVVK